MNDEQEAAIDKDEHILELNALDDHEHRYQIASQCGLGIHKALYVLVRDFCVSFEVENHRDVILATTDKHKAIVTYNLIRRKPKSRPIADNPTPTEVTITEVKK